VLTEAQILRYSRQILLREVGGAGQEKLLATPVQATGVTADLLAAGGSPRGDDGVSVAAGSDSVVWTRCSRCLDQHRPPGEPTVYTSAWAALGAQLHVLGLAGAGVLRFDADGIPTRVDLPACPH
jgi:hypothetical protein